MLNAAPLEARVNDVNVSRSFDNGLRWEEEGDDCAIGGRDVGGVKHKAPSGGDVDLGYAY
jgi:hypothetical protein